MEDESNYEKLLRVFDEFKNEMNDISGDSEGHGE
jgi:hypothetical protein